MPIVQPLFPASFKSSKATLEQSQVHESAWTTLTSWSSVNDGTYVTNLLNDALIVRGAKANATVSASVKYTGLPLGKSCRIRICRPDGTIVATGVFVSASAGIATVSKVLNVLNGDQFIIQGIATDTGGSWISGTDCTFTIS